MRLALLGPADGNVDALEVAAKFALEAREVDRAVYLGLDGAMDVAVSQWAADLVGGDASEQGVFARAAKTCVRATAEDIDRHLARERARGALRVFESLPNAETRAIEMLGGALVVMIHDKAWLDEEDMLPARVLVFGRSRSPVVKQVGQRWFLSPGSLAEGGLMTLEDAEDAVLLSCFDADLKETRRERLAIHRGTKMTVSGAGA